jgi:hypothetical protein
MILYLFSNVAMNIAAAGWVTWMAAIIPASIRGRYFGARNRITGFVSIAGNLAAGSAVPAPHPRAGRGDDESACAKNVQRV